MTEAESQPSRQLDISLENIGGLHVSKKLGDFIELNCPKATIKAKHQDIIAALDNFTKLDSQVWLGHSIKGDNSGFIRDLTPTMDPEMRSPVVGLPIIWKFSLAEGGFGIMGVDNGSIIKYFPNCIAAYKDNCSMDEDQHILFWLQKGGLPIPVLTVSTPKKIVARVINPYGKEDDCKNYVYSFEDEKIKVPQNITEICGVPILKST